ncbi:MAG: hypothetical protein CMN56_02440 [Sneathiella sp.]|uniref:hypothetical protein n=1 Tax=Sneathiella sp. TaxID=1964365 RepID=UPI000C56E057|nr:hypothetical protein [Sneathiella sp.]MAZ01974.1 hypothetical protein [Sneathiella sp.]
MYARIEKAGNAQNLQFGSVMGTLFNTVTCPQHFKISTLLQSMRKHMRLAKEKTEVVVDLTKGPLSVAVNDGVGFTRWAANENCPGSTTESYTR